ncbi:MAG: hypothetical protein QM723_32040 [Myxococcaceae bacterium]
MSRRRSSPSTRPRWCGIAAKSGAGTACTVVDKVRGPFESSGTAGRTNCELDLLLDIGSYKLRLSSPHRGKGNVAITAKAFTELNPKPVRLEKTRRVEQVLHSGEQASFWLSLSKREVPFLHLVGKNAGQVQLWRNGEWLEPIELRHTTFSAGLNRSVHEWTLDQMVEPGEYLITAYGTKGLSGTSGEASDALTVEYGFEPMPPERVASFTLPSTGTLSWLAPKGAGSFLLTLDEAPSATVQLSAGELFSPSYLEWKPSAPNETPPPERGLTVNASARLEPKKLVPQAAVTVGQNEPHVVNIKGPPGARGLLEWAPSGSAARPSGYYGYSQRSFDFQVWGGGDYLIGLDDLPADTDAAPLGCTLRQDTLKGRVPIGHDVPMIADGQMLDRQFNYDGSNGIVWFEVKKSDRYRISTSGERKSRCELWRMDDKGALQRLGESPKPDAKVCNVAQPLTAGVYQVSLYDGLPGIEHLTIREDTQRPLTPIATHAGCLIQAKGIEAGKYVLEVNRGGDVTARGLVVEPLPLPLDQPVHLVMDPGRTLKLPVSGSGVARSAANKAFGCNGANVAGQCPVSGTELTLANGSAEVIAVTLFRPAPPRASAPLRAFDAKAAPLPKATLDSPVYFDFATNESHSLVFEVSEAGLYNVTTQGLLTTECRLRTPVVPALARDSGSGRGRNCLVSGYLRPGRYMLTAATTGASRGRGALVMTRRNPHEFASVAQDGEAFFRVDAGDLVQQKLVIRTGGQYTLSTTGQGVSLQCRLDDSDGWPLVTVPTSCSQTRDFAAGTYLWTQLPLTVESMRHTALPKVREAVVLKGNKPHPVDFHTWYTAQLGTHGKDEFTFSLAGELTLDVVLTNGMQGRIYLLEADKPPKPVEVIPAQQVAQQPENEGVEGEGSSEGESYQPPPEEGSSEGMEGGEGSEGSEGDDSPPPPRKQVQLLQARAAPAEAQGVRITLPRGNYKLVAEHSRGDIGVEYQLHLSSEVMLPPMSRDLPVPVAINVKMPKDGVLRLKTEGEADVRCRVFEGERLVFEGADNGADWNCAVAEPLTAGDYRLIIESETQRAGNTRLSLATAPVEEGGLAKDGAGFKLAQAVETISLPAAEKDAVEEISFRSKTPISCALEDGAGQVVHRKARVTDCSMLVRPGTEKFKVRVWTTDGVAQVSESFRVKPVANAPKGSVSGTNAALVSMPHPGRYTTSPQVFCIAGNQHGVLRNCGPEASVDGGPQVFAVFGVKDQPLPLEEVVLATAAAEKISLTLSRQNWLSSLSATKRSVFLVSAEVQHGERVAPACVFTAGVRESKERSCFAVSNAGTSAIVGAWAPVSPDAPLRATLTRRAITLPSSAPALAPGRSRLKLSPEGSMFSLPSSQRARLELTLPGDAWAVLLDDGGTALDFCAPVGPSQVLSRCVLTGKAGKLLVASSDSQLDVTTVLLDVPEKSVAFNALYEDDPVAPGYVKLRAAASDSDRVALVEGDAKCTFVFTDGTRVSGCKASVPKNVGVEVQLEHSAGPLRAMISAPGRDRWARLNIELPPVPGAGLAAANAVPLTGSRIDRTLVLQKDSVVRVTSDSGVCGLFKGNDLLAVDGLGTGCELVRLVSAGTYRVLVRPFAGQTVPGALRWTAEPVVTLGDGVGPEDWVAPAEVRVYRFSTGSKGWVGLGVQTGSEALDCSIYDDGHRLLGDGCQQYMQLDKGNYLLTVRMPPKTGAQPLRFKPVLLGLAGATTGVPDEYLKELFRRIGVNQ